MAEVHVRKHDYFLADPSPWPLAASAAAFTTAFGGVVWMNTPGGVFGLQGPWLFVIGAVTLAAVLTLWWYGVVAESIRIGGHTPVVQLHLRYGMILFIASEVMFFFAWFWAYYNSALFPADVIKIPGTDTLIGVVGRGEVTGGQWPPVATPDGRFTAPFDPWHIPLVNTLILLTSGTTVTYAHHALLEGDRKGLVRGLVLTILLGMVFTALQVFEYSHARFTFAGHIYGSTFFMATGFHGLHVIIGTLFLIVVLFRALAGHFTPQRHFGFEAAAWYWHFVDVVWLFLFASIYVWGGVGTVQR